MGRRLVPQPGSGSGDEESMRMTEASNAVASHRSWEARLRGRSETDNGGSPLGRMSPLRGFDAGGVTEISRWQAPKARRHRFDGDHNSHPGRGAGERQHVAASADATPAGVGFQFWTFPVAARLRRLPPANLRHASRRARMAVSHGASSRREKCPDSGAAPACHCSTRDLRRRATMTPDLRDLRLFHD
jgi:hypothetical protein